MFLRRYNQFIEICFSFGTIIRNFLGPRFFFSYQPVLNVFLENIKSYSALKQRCFNALYDFIMFFANQISAITSTSTSTSLGSVFTATHERAGLLVKYSA